MYNLNNNSLLRKNMANRLSQQALYTLIPRIPKHLIELGNIDFSLNNALNQTIIHLVKIRVSQINHCAFCLNMHINEARKNHETQARLDILSEWQEVDAFTDAEKTALAWSEALTTISQATITDEIYQSIINAFGEQGMLELTTVILEINSWNRIAVSLEFKPDI